MREINKENSVQEQENPWVSLGKDLLSVVAVLIIFMVFSKLAFGLWTPMVAVESGSMEPHMQVGDIIFIKSADRVDIITNEEGKNTGYMSFEDYGDVILYRPYGEGVGVNDLVFRITFIKIKEGCLLS